MTDERMKLKADCKALAGLKGGITHINRSDRSRWLKLTHNGVIEVCVHGRDVAPMFEVFALDLRTADAGSVQRGDWRPWPFRSWQVDVMTREEFVEPVDPDLPTFGEPGNSQAAVRPGHVPQEATSRCLVDVGLLFTGDSGERLMIAADWFPFNLAVSEDEAEIDDFLRSCVLTSLADYTPA